MLFPSVALLLSIARGQIKPQLEHDSNAMVNNSLLFLEEVGEDANNVLKCLCCRPADTMTVEEFGLPSRVRMDVGGENRSVASYMIEQPEPGPGRGSVKTGRSNT